MGLSPRPVSQRGAREAKVVATAYSPSQVRRIASRAASWFATSSNRIHSRPSPSMYTSSWGMPCSPSTRSNSPTEASVNSARSLRDSCSAAVSPNRFGSAKMTASTMTATTVTLFHNGY